LSFNSHHMRQQHHSKSGATTKSSEPCSRRCPEGRVDWRHTGNALTQLRCVAARALHAVANRALRPLLPGQNAMVCDKNWNLIQSGAYKFHPNDGQGVPVPLQIGSKLQVNVTFSVQSAAGWSKLRLHSVEAEIVSAETISTKAGQFETYRLEITSKFRGSSTTPLSVNELMTGWFSPKVDHFVRAQIETRTDGHLTTKNSSELIEYEVK
jgi:hypothetical protein